MVNEEACGARSGLWVDRYAILCRFLYEETIADEGLVKDEFEGLAIFIDTYANARHGYSFPRITAMLGDGKTKYDHDNDGDANTLGACSVCSQYVHKDSADSQCSLGKRPTDERPH